MTEQHTGQSTGNGGDEYSHIHELQLEPEIRNDGLEIVYFFKALESDIGPGGKSAWRLTENRAVSRFTVDHPHFGNQIILTTKGPGGLIEVDNEAEIHLSDYNLSILMDQLLEAERVLTCMLDDKPAEVRPEIPGVEVVGKSIYVDLDQTRKSIDMECVQAAVEELKPYLRSERDLPQGVSLGMALALNLALVRHQAKFVRVFTGGQLAKVINDRGEENYAQEFTFPTQNALSSFDALLGMVSAFPSKFKRDASQEAVTLIAARLSGPE